VETKYLIGILVVIVAIGGATACTFFIPSGNTQNPVSTSDPAAAAAPAVNDASNSQTNTQTNVQAQKVTCTKCGGDGVISCSKCGGDGVITSGGKCSACGGDGKRIDNGDGTFSAIVAVLACHEVTCSVCGGTGGSASKTACGACGGDGKITCSKCGGDGFYYS